MKRRHVHVHVRPYFPVSFFIFSLLFMMFVGWKLMLFLPLLLLMLVISSWSRTFHSVTLQPIEIDKRKRKPKNDDAFHGDYI